MTAAHITRRQSHQPARGIVGTLLLYRIEWTDEWPAFGFIGAAVVCAIFAVIKWRFL